VWILAIAALIVSTVASVKGIYPTQASLDRAAAAIDGNAAVIALNGPPFGLRTLGGRVAFESGSFGLVVVGLMSVLMIGCHTRAEEESGRRSSCAPRSSAATRRLRRRWSWWPP
jgi:ABC-2 type transport system permease protein